MEWLRRSFESARGEAGHNVRPMEGLRGFAVFLVFLVHYVTVVTPWVALDSGLGAFMTSVKTFGHAGVDLFFLLSGYLIYGSLIARPQRFTRFITRRVQRIYPAFTVVFVLYVALSFLFPAENKIPDGLGAGATYLLQNYFMLPGMFPIEPMITVAWSLSYEIFFYLLIPLLISVFAMRERSTRWRVGFFLSLVAALAVYYATLGAHGYIRLVMFLSGVLLYEAMQTRRGLASGAVAGLLGLVGGLAAMLVPTWTPLGGTLKYLILATAFFVLCRSCFFHPRDWLGRAFSWTPLRWLGNMSYSYYLLHGLAMKAFFLLVVPTLVTPGGTHAALFWIMLPVTFVLSLVPTVMLYLLVELPFSIAPRKAGKAVPVPSWANTPVPDSGPMQPEADCRTPDITVIPSREP